MSKKKTYIGYDLGDGETITDLAALDKEQVNGPIQIRFDAMVMPDNNTPGQAIPTVYGYCKDKIVFASTILEDPEMVRDVHVNFKRRPSDLINTISEERKGKIVSLLEKNWPDSKQCPELYNDQMQQFSDAVITFTNAIFAEEKYQQKIADAAFECDEIVFCVGHPTKWNELDVAIYKGILRKSVLGSKKYVSKATSLVMAAESRAAFLHIKNQGKTNALPKGTVALLIDVGSSTVDITAMTEDSRNHVYNSGNNYLGARCVDFAIQKWYEDRLKKDPEDWANHLKLMEYNPSMKKSLTLACRMAKEKCYSTSVARATIPDDFGAKAKITAEDINKLISTIPVAQLLKDRTVLPAEVEKFMGNQSYSAVFREFMESEKKAMDKAGINVGRVILTGSASQMGFARTIVQEVFGGKQILMDMDPSRSISMGLALVGPSNEKSEKFQQDISKLLDNEIPAIISSNMGILADSISPVIQQNIEKIVMMNFQKWQSGQIKTLNQMSSAIEKACEGQNLAESLGKDPAYIRNINTWLTDNVGRDIALKLKGICNKYGVENLTVDDLNIMKVPTISIGRIQLNPLDGMLNVINTIVTVIASIVVAVLTPTIVAILGILTADIVTVILLIIFEFLSINPEVGVPLLAVIAGVSVAVLIKKGLQGLKDVIMEKMQSYDLPKWVRKLVSVKKINQKIAAKNLRATIRNAILNEEEKNQIVTEVAKNLRSQVANRADEIKYIIESK